MEKLLFEIGTEEIPANFMPGIMTQLKELGEKKLKEQRIPFTGVKTYGTPRRMTLLVEGIPENQADSVVEAKGPAKNIAFGPDGAPTKAAMGFARGKGVEVKDLELRADNYVYAVKHLQGEPVEKLLPVVLKDILTSLSFPKNMRWADFDFRFVRPIHWLVALFGTKIVPVEITDVKSGRCTLGHRFLSKGLVELASADEYEKVLGEHFVMVDQDQRRETIRRQIVELAQAEGGEAQITPDLLEEVNYLVEYPTALCGKFEDKYLALPKEVVITPMRDHQRYFPVLDKDGKLLNKFITIRNGGKEHLETVAHGNERVLRARLSDAEFFFNEDRKVKLADRLEKLKTVVFQEGLGNMNDKSKRLAESVGVLNALLDLKLDQEELKRAALLCKTDLVTGMVTEFTELQGVMGREYALLDGEKPAVATAIYEHYLPRFAGDDLPKSDMGRLISLADKLDNIVATFSRGLAPTGSQDPYALRRQALGILNILIEAQYHVGLLKMLGNTFMMLGIPAEKTKTLGLQVVDFIYQRFRNMLLDQGIRYDVVDAVLAEGRNADIYDLYLRAQALNSFVLKPEAAALLQVAIRVCNLSSKIEQKVKVKPELFREQAEKNLFDSCKAQENNVIGATVKHDYLQSLSSVLPLIDPINKFFDDVMVMDKDEAVKKNRLALLDYIRQMINAAGDLSKIVQA